MEHWTDRHRPDVTAGPRRLLLGIPVVLMVASCLWFRPAFAAIPASNTQEYGVIARTALAAVGQYGGQCFPWARSVVLAATGQRIGFDYRAGYLQAGFAEVSAQDARNGDVIQIVNDANTDPSADYLGMHTSIVIDNEGGGVFRVVDSNWEFDGIVRIRDQYDPAAEAGRYPGLSFHFYRFNSGASTPAVVSTATAAAGSTTSSLPAASGAAAPLPGSYTVLAGDTLSGIATRFQPLGIDLDAFLQQLYAANGLSADSILSIGQVILFPSPSTPAAVSVGTPPAPSTSAVAAGTYTVVGGDTLSGIAARFQPGDVTLSVFLQALYAANNLDAASILSVGQIISIPSSLAGTSTASDSTPAGTTPDAPVSYTVAAGDTLSSIAARFQPAGVGLDDFIQSLYTANSLNADSVLSIGETISIR